MDSFAKFHDSSLLEKCCESHYKFIKGSKEKEFLSYPEAYHIMCM